MTLRMRSHLALPPPHIFFTTLSLVEETSIGTLIELLTLREISFQLLKGFYFIFGHNNRKYKERFQSG